MERFVYARIQLEAKAKLWKLVKNKLKLKSP